MSEQDRAAEAPGSSTGSSTPGSSTPGAEESGDATAQRRTAEWERARRRAEVFGETLPETTSDERDTSGSRGSRDGDTWLVEQVPPHHGG